MRPLEDTGFPFPVTIVEAPTNSFEITALIGLANCSGASDLLPLHSAFFFLHDTTFVGPNFTSQVSLVKRESICGSSSPLTPHVFR